MTNESQDRLRRVERSTLVCAVIAIVVAAALGWRAPTVLAPAWRLAVFACLQPALGSLIFVLIFRLTGGQWMRELAPFLAAGVRLLPWIWLLALPLLWSPMTAIDETTRHLDPTLRGYFSRPMLTARAVGYAIAFFLLAAGAVRILRRPAVDRLRWFGPAGLIGLVFMLHLLAVDWFVRLEPGWYSTGFPLVWTAGQGLAGFAAATTAALCFGADPASAGGAGRARGLDWGNLLLASVMAWTYVAFVEWLIIWSGNLPAETAWFRRRAEGVWLALLVALALLEFATPFALLLSRGVKRSRRGLMVVAALLLAGQLGYTVWLIGPALPRGDASAAWLSVAVGVAALALFLNRYLAAARRAAVVVLP